MTFARGDVVQVGRHRLMCGDAGDPDDVARLFAGAKPDLIFTSPPYLQQRVYGKAIECWDTLMQRVFGAMPHHETTQVLVNLGLVHRGGEWTPYWDDWIEWMRSHGWRRFGWYVWDKLTALPGDWHGRLAPSFEFVFHFCKQPRSPNKSVPCKFPGQQRKRFGNSERGGYLKGGWSGKLQVHQTHKIPEATIRIMAERGNRGIGHPAMFPVALPLAVIDTYTLPRESIYDPFCGSGTSILAAERGGRVCYGMEIEPSYCDIALQRWASRKPQQKALAI